MAIGVTTNLRRQPVTYGAGIMPDYLHTCLGLHPTLMEILYDRESIKRKGIKRIEDAAASIREKGQILYEDIEKIVDQDVWNADLFGYWPKSQEIEETLKSKKWNFKSLPAHEGEVIKDMYSIFHQIEIVSVILRFIMPKEYGIISPPVEKVLGINSFGNHRMSSENLHLDKYSTYLKDLREIKKERKFDRVADVDMALWVLQMGILERRFEASKCKKILQNFRKDSKLRAVQARNLTMYLFDPGTMKRI